MSTKHTIKFYPVDNAEDVSKEMATILRRF